MEIWKDIPGYEGVYLVSNKGNIKRISTNKILKPYENKRNGYLTINLSNKGRKNLRIHRIVAKAFLPNPNNKPYINHIDGNKKNNNITNLEWCTQKENVDHAIKVLGVDHKKGIEKTHEKSKKKVIRSDGKIYSCIQEAKQEFPNAHIVEVCQGKLKTTKGYGWKYYKEVD